MPTTPPARNPAAMLAALLALALAFAPACRAIIYDNIVIGAGIGGMASAVYLKDLGRSVLVLEKAEDVGGCCHTVTFPDAPPGQPNHLDPGVIALINTTDVNVNAYGGFPFWPVDTIAFARRFVGEDAFIVAGPPAGSPIYGADFATGTFFGQLPPFVPGPDFFAAMARLGAVFAQHPWLDNPVRKPNPLPSELLVPWSDFVASHQLEPILPAINGALYSGGMGNYSTLTAIYALENVAPSVLNGIFSPTGQVGYKDGCISLYRGMQDYLGEDNVLTDVDVTHVVRPPAGFAHVPTVVAGIRPHPNHPRLRIPFVHLCRGVVLSVPPTRDHIEFMDLDPTEVAAFDGVVARSYAAATVDVDGPVANGTEFILVNVDPTQPFGGLPVPPTAAVVFRSLPYGWAEAPTISDTPLDAAGMTAALADSLSALPPIVFARKNVTSLFLHVFQPHYPLDKLNPSSFALLEALNDAFYRNTLTISSISSFPDHAHIITAAYYWISRTYGPERRRDAVDTEADPAAASAALSGWADRVRDLLLRGGGSSRILAPAVGRNALRLARALRGV